MNPNCNCHRCIYFRYSSAERGVLCEAFPDGAPIEIVNGEVPHTEPYEGDSGLQFTPLLRYGLSMDEVASKG